jgi:hypothetical protein
MCCRWGGSSCGLLDSSSSFEYRRTRAGFSVICAASEPTFLLTTKEEKQREKETSQLPLIVVLGSSVAAGRGAKRGRGWVELVGSELASEGRFRVCNLAVKGATTKSTLELLKEVLKKNDDVWSEESKVVVVVSLSLSNEKKCVKGGGRSSAALLSQHYVSGLFQLSCWINSVSSRKKKKKNISFFVCGPYPADDEGEEGKGRREGRRERRRGEGEGGAMSDRVAGLLSSEYGPMFCNFHTPPLRNLNGTGWLPELRMDRWHPNNHGHKVMANLFLKSFPL